MHLLSTLAESSLTLAALLLALGICMDSPVFGFSTARRFPATTARGPSSVSSAASKAYARLRDERREGAAGAIVV